MKTRSRLAMLAIILIAGNAGMADEGGREPRRAQLTDQSIRSEERLYRKAPEGELFLHLYFPADWKAVDRRPAIVFFFGGAWKTGSYLQFVEQAKYFASRGLVAASADYRILNKHRTTPVQSVEDAMSAVRWLRTHADELGIDANKIIAAGGSAGGHLAAATALLEGFSAAGDDASVSCRPSALVLFNPVLNLTGPSKLTLPKGDREAIKKQLSPTLYLQGSSPPAVLFYGSDDKYLAQGKEYADKAKELAVRADVYVAPGATHGFMNHTPWTEVTTQKADEFLTSLGYLKGTPTVKLPKDAPRLKKL